MSNAESLAYFMGNFIGIAAGCGANLEVAAETEAKLDELIRLRAKTQEEIASAQRYKQSSIDDGKKDKINGTCPVEGDDATGYLRNLGARIDAAIAR